MATLKLISLIVRNFKGVQDFILDAQGGDVAVYGDNATGKTTLADAFMWLLFDKDSRNRKDFEIKTIGPDGQPVHGLEHEVEGILALGNKRVNLRKVYSEKWTKQRGSATAQFTGHTTDHWIDGVPVKLAEYKAKVAEMADEGAFRLVTDPAYFNEVLHWQKRREVLLTVCGDVSDREVIDSDPELASLPKILGDRSLSDHRKVIAARRTEINRELERIPVRIDEATRALPEAQGDRSSLASQIALLRDQRQTKASEQVRIQAGGEAAERTKKLREIEGEMLQVGQRLRSSADQQIQQERARLAAITDQVDAKRREIRRMVAEGAETMRDVRRLNERLWELRSAWGEINGRQFTHSMDEFCPACRQPLPEGELAAAHESALAAFNTRRSTDLERNVADGQSIKAKLTELEQAKEQCEHAAIVAEQDLITLDDQAKEIQARIDQLRQEMPDASADTEYRRLDRAKAQLAEEITGLKAGTAAAVERVTEVIRELDGQISSLESAVGRIDQRESGLLRIDQLREQERNLAVEYERLEQELYLTEQFTRVKVRMIEDRINSRFRFARFKLFNVQVNGGLEDCCETLYQGVPYSSALNTGARINVGLDIINTLSEHYQFEAPIWIDNREAVTKLIPTRSQVISLVVSEPDKQLRVTTETAQKEAV